MKLLRALGFCLIASTARALEVEDFFDRLDNTLTIAAFEDNLRARLSGTIDLEAYHFQQPAPGLIDSKINLDRRFISLLSHGLIAGSIPAITELRFASMNMRFALRLGMMAVSICKSGNLRPLSVLGSRGICHGRIHLSMRRWFTRTSLPLATKTRRFHLGIS